MNDIETVAETTQPEAWPKVSLMDLIIERGKGCIYGKFGDWMINGKPVLSHSVRPGALNPACFFGGLTFSPHNDPFLRITTLIYENTPDNQKTANFLRSRNNCCSILVINLQHNTFCRVGRKCNKINNSCINALFNRSINNRLAQKILNK